MSGEYGRTPSNIREYSPLKKKTSQRGRSFEQEKKELYNEWKLLVYSFFQVFTGFEGWSLGSRDFDFLTWVLRVYTRASRTLRNLERTETGNRYLATLFEFAGNGTDDCLKGITSYFLGTTARFCDCFYEVAFGQSHDKSGLEKAS